VYYSLFIVVMMVEMLEKEIPPAVAPEEFPPQLFTGYVSVLVFWCLCGALLPRCAGDPFYRSF
jgi:hypothetical protein